ncbi:hypothetical protein DL766_007686 [Monosporascus sp. MC13-8B]|nr:hypothetical protein DL763_000377 [Monosporascus cannonballus]RYP22609.1 hypothetical protein DL766_007686 [Monosporascus sp. MC13-8B]
MKLSAFTLLATVFLSSTASAAVANVPRDTVDTGILLEPKQCGAADSCRGTGGGKLCNNRYKKCSGPSGKYKSDERCGFGWQ